MIPYFSWTTIQIGPLAVQVWGLFVALGFLFAALVAGWFVKKRYQGDAKIIYDLAGWSVLAGMLGGRLGHVFYEPEYYLNDPLAVLRIWEGGMSFFGGLLLASLVGVLYLRKRHMDVWQYSDAVFFGLPVGLWIGRIGCFLIHDHPGTATDFALGVEYPDGVVRHDHGLYLSLNGFILALVFFLLSRKERPAGFYIAFFSVWYGVIRFFLDFFRINDVKYLSLTPAQYGAIALVAFGLWLFWRLFNTKRL